jgi:hypothetical protein
MNECLIKNRQSFLIERERERESATERVDYDLISYKKTMITKNKTKQTNKQITRTYLYPLLRQHQHHSQTPSQRDVLDISQQTTKQKSE